MRIIKLGSNGDDVLKFQQFLIGRGYEGVIASGIFDEETENAVKSFQESEDLLADGVIGNYTYGNAMSKYGFGLIHDTSDFTSWPPRPIDVRPPTDSNRKSLFGIFEYEPNPTSGNLEGILIKGDWASKNIISVNIPQLSGIQGAPRGCNVQFHKKAAPQLENLFREWEENGLIKHIETWAGSWNPRFIRGSRTTLSNHAFGTAFDINAQWNALGVVPARKGKFGSVRELVEIANKNGFFWGGHFTSRPDGMHFEVAKIL